MFAGYQRIKTAATRAPTITWLCLPVLLFCATTAGADFRAAKKAFDAGRYEEAVSLWQAAGKQGDLESIYHLGKRAAWIFLTSGQSAVADHHARQVPATTA